MMTSLSSDALDLMSCSRASLKLMLAACTDGVAEAELHALSFRLACRYSDKPCWGLWASSGVGRATEAATWSSTMEALRLYDEAVDGRTFVPSGPPCSCRAMGRVMMILCFSSSNVTKVSFLFSRDAWCSNLTLSMAESLVKVRKSAPYHMQFRIITYWVTANCRLLIISACINRAI